jgi:tetratricopeptide (TPR) repeat protein
MTGAQKAILVGMLSASSLVGCGKEAAPSAEAVEPSSGGETSVQAGSAEAAAAAADPVAAASPWGQTRAEKCRPPARRPLDRKARVPFEAGALAAASYDIGTATAKFEKALDLDPQAYPALYNLGVLSDRAGEEAKARDFYRRALRAQPDYEAAARGLVAIALRKEQVGEALDIVQPLATEYPTNLHLQALYAEVLVEARRYEEAWMAGRQALRCDERFVPALTALVKASLAQGREELADSILEQALAIDPNVAELHFLQGERLKDEPGRLREAMASYERAVELRPDYAEARMALGVQLLAGGNYPLALTHFETTEKLIPMEPAVHVNLGDAYRATEQWIRAEESYVRALELQRKLPEAHFGLGLLYLSAAGELPGLDEVSALRRSQEEFNLYRAERGPRLAKNDISEEYLRDLDRLISRAQRRIEREQEQARREAERGEREDGTPQ